jgi:primosomal replication protein N
MNTCLLSGTLQRSPAFAVRSGLSICRLHVRIARQQRRGGALERAPFDVEVSTFGKSAERARELRRGALVTVRGRLDPYQARDGNLRVALVADELEWGGR